MTLDHIIKERYPTFVDALRDLDDALSMLFLFANLPQTDTVPPKTIQLCQRLCLEFEHYLIRTHSLRKSFLSIKGIYYQATIQGQDILWLVPYKFVQRVTGDVDFRIMGTFVEFYTTLLGFVNYRLYTGIGLVYPPKFNAKSDEAGAELAAFTLEGRGVGEQQTVNGGEQLTEPKQVSASAQAEADKLLALPATEGAEETTVDKELEAADAADQDAAESNELDNFPAPIDPNSDTLTQPSISSSTAATLFEPFTFFLGRETPRTPLEFILRAFGCKRVGWDAVLGEGSYTSDESDRRITHQIVDRPNLPGLPAAEGTVRRGERVPGRTYIQPQWVWDCINAGRLLRTDLYAPGATLPPHLSPWVKARKGEYDPTKSLAEQEAEGEAEAAAEDEELEDEEELAKAAEEEADAVDGEGSEDEEVAGVRGDSETRDMEAALLAKGGKEVVDEHGMNVELAGSDDESEDEAAPDEDFAGFDDDDDEEGEEEGDADNEALQHQRELEAEARGAPVSPAANKADAGSTPGKALRQKSGQKGEAQKRAEKKKREEEEEVERQKMMLSRRKRKLFEKMQYSNKKKDEEAEKLRAKRRRLEKAKK